MRAGNAGWGVVVPVKLLPLAKTRLLGYDDETRQQLALAFAQDVVLAALACTPVAEVLVVTDDTRAAAALSQLGARIGPDSPAAGLNPALEHGATVLRAERPDVAVVTVAADLPALRAHELADLLATVRGRAFVPDVAGTGTTLLAAAAGQRLGPRFGPDSRAQHLVSGAQELPGTPGLRRDVDTTQDLAAALALGVGSRTTALAAALAAACSPGPGTMRG